MKLRLAVLLTALIISALALGQATLGNIIKLGTSTHANLPASSTTIQGGLIYNLDAGAMYVNDGTAWAALGAGSASYWIDGGGGAIYTEDWIAMPDAGPTVFMGPGSTTGIVTPVVTIDTSSGSGNDVGAITFRENDTANGLYGAIWGQRGADATRNRGLNFWIGSQGLGNAYHLFSYGGTPSAPTTYMGVMTATGELAMSALTGTNAFSAATGARWKIGGGTTDYLESNGVGAGTPGYWKVGPFTDAGLPAAAAGNLGALAYGSSTGGLKLSDGTTWVDVSKERLRFSGTCYGAAGVEECEDGQTFGVAYAEDGKNYANRMTCGWHTAGSGGTKVVVRLVSTADALIDCRCDMGACTGTTPVTCACNTAFPTGAVLMQNLQVHLDGGIFGDCTTHPGNIYCTVE